MEAELYTNRESAEEAQLNDTGAAVERFAALAEEYCDFIERLAEQSGRQIVQTSVRLLPALYLAALTLPDIEPGDGDLTDAASSGMDEYRAVYGRVSEKLGSLTIYWEVYDPYEEDTPVCGSIGDDLADIYRDLKAALIVYQEGDRAARQEAVWHWRFHFLFHWGDHLVNALRALHRAHTNRLVDEEIERMH